MSDNNWKSAHNLPFESAQYHLQVDDNYDWQKFRIGTCEGLWCDAGTSYNILAITNSKPGNGHFDDVMQWFERSCRRDKKNFIIMEVWNKSLFRHLINKRGFKIIVDENVIKGWRQCAIPTTQQPE